MKRDTRHSNSIPPPSSPVSSEQEAVREGSSALPRQAPAYHSPTFPSHTLVLERAKVMAFGLGAGAGEAARISCVLPLSEPRETGCGKGRRAREREGARRDKPRRTNSPTFPSHTLVLERAKVFPGLSGSALPHRSALVSHEPCTPGLVSARPLSLWLAGPFHTLSPAALTTATHKKCGPLPPPLPPAQKP